MHEMSLAEGVLGIIEEAAAAQGFNRVRTIWLEVGRLAGVEKEALRFSLEVVLHDSIAAHAALEIIDLPGQGWCMQCAQTVEIEASCAVCPRCGSPQVQVSGGNQLRVKELEVEQEGSCA